MHRRSCFDFEVAAIDAEFSLCAKFASGNCNDHRMNWKALGHLELVLRALPRTLLSTRLEATPGPSLCINAPTI